MHKSQDQSISRALARERGSQGGMLLDDGVRLNLDQGAFNGETGHADGC